MIGILKHRLAIEYIDYVYLEHPVPTTYTDYKTRIIEKDNLIRRRNAITSGHRTLLGGAPQRTSGPHKTGTGITYGGRGQPMDIGRQKTDRRIWNDKHLIVHRTNPLVVD